MNGCMEDVLINNQSAKCSIDHFDPRRSEREEEDNQLAIVILSERDERTIRSSPRIIFPNETKNAFLY